MSVSSVNLKCFSVVTSSLLTPAGRPILTAPHQPQSFITHRQSSFLHRSSLKWKYQQHLLQRITGRVKMVTAGTVCRIGLVLDTRYSRLPLIIGLFSFSWSCCWTVTLYNVVLISIVQRSESAACEHIPPPSWASFPPSPHPTALSSSWSTELSSLCCREASHYLCHSRSSICVHPDLPV